MNGVRLEGKKEASLLNWSLKRIKRPGRVRIPLYQFPGTAAIPCVQIGDTVEAGQKVALPEGPSGVALHASISGRVTAVESFPHPVLGFCPAVEIKSDERERVLSGIGAERPGWASLGREDLLNLFQESGLVAMRGEPISLHQKIRLAEGDPVQTFVLNACESESYVTSEHSLLMSHPMEILKGAEIIRQLYGAEKLVIALLDDKMEIAELLKSKIFFLKWDHVDIRILKNTYPQGMTLPLLHTLFELDLIKRIHAVRASLPELPAAVVMDRVVHEAGVAVLDPASVYAVYEAVVLQKPFYERPVTVAGECVIEPANFMVPLGLSLQDTLKAAKGLMREPGRVVMGGPMQGVEVVDLEAPVIAGATAVLALPKEVVRSGNVESCIHSGHCVNACPVEISPVMITLAAEHDLFLEAEDWGLAACIDCGNCTYVCPSKRPMAELIHYAREGLKAAVQGKTS